MEDILDVYEMPHAPRKSVVCMDEMPYQLLGEVRQPLPVCFRDTEKKDYEYVHNENCNIFAFIESLSGKHHVNTKKHRTAVDWAEEIKYLVDVMYPDVEKIILVMDNLNIHVKSSLYKKFPPEEARRIIRKLKFHYIPKHSRWLNIAKIELNILNGQCLHAE